MLYPEKQRAIKKEALYILKKTKPSKIQMTWWLNAIEKYEDTDDIWIIQKLN